MSEPGKREKLLSATKDLLLEVGYESMSPRMILDRSGAGQGSLYHHFSGKKQLARTVLDDIYAELKADLLNVFENESLTPLAKIDRYLARPRQGLKGCKLGRLANEKSLADAELGQPLRAFFIFALQEVSGQLKHAVETGELPNDTPVEALAHLIIAAIQGGYVLSRATDNNDAVNLATDGARQLLKACQL